MKFFITFAQSYVNSLQGQNLYYSQNNNDNAMRSHQTSN